MELVASLNLIAPEILLSVSGLVLLLVAAWAGDKAASGISIVYGLSCAARKWCGSCGAPWKVLKIKRQE